MAAAVPAGPGPRPAPGEPDTVATHHAAGGPAPSPKAGA